MLCTTTLRRKNGKEGVSPAFTAGTMPLLGAGPALSEIRTGPQKLAGEDLDLVETIALSLFLMSSSSHVVCVPLPSLPHPAHPLCYMGSLVPGLILLLRHCVTSST